MSKKNLAEFFDELDDSDVPESRRFQKRVIRKRESKRQEADVNLFIRAQEISRDFTFTYKAARFEEAWLLDSLIDISEYNWISDVLRKIKVGKEASVYLCRSGSAIQAPYVAAKIYRPRSLRNLKNDSQYREGRVDLDEDGNTLWKEADVNAIIKRTSYGEEVRHRSWMAYEFKTLEMLYEAGADVPKPYAIDKNTIVMDYIGDLSSPAPLLTSVTLDRDEVHPLFERVIRNIDLILSKERIHGDLSAYNILYWGGDITLIDFPQVVQPESNPASWTIFLRDVTRICQYFASQGLKRDARKLATELWTSHGHRVVKEVHPSQLDADDPNDRKLWEKQKSIK
jgi:RIO kinase 1